MNRSAIVRAVARIMTYMSASFLIPAIVGIIYGEYKCSMIFFFTGIIAFAIFVFPSFIKPERKKIFAREGLVIAAITWIIFSIVAAFPFFISGSIPNFIDALFESVSGDTTTGATILTDVESLPKCMLFWRSFLHWIGGMGVIVFAMIVLPSSAGTLYLMQAESPGPSVSKLVPKGKNTAAYLYGIYSFITLLLIILLCLGGMPIFDSICHAFGAVGTGGFSVKNDGISHYHSAYIEYVLSFFMIACGVNFSLYYYLLKKKFSEIKKNTELKVYLIIILIAIILIALSTFKQYDSFASCMRYTVFQVASIITSTGFSTTDITKWSQFAQNIAMIIMFIGACAGSTGGGFKVSRFVIIAKSAKLTIRKMLHPNSINVVKADGKIIDSDQSHSVMRYTVLLGFIFIISVLLVSINDYDFTTTFSSVLTAISNNGVALGEAGKGNLAFYSDFSKLVLTLDMLIGRLEILPILILFFPSIWRKKF